MHAPGFRNLLLVLAALAVGGGCAPFMRPYDDLGVWLDRYPFGPQRQPTQSRQWADHSAPMPVRLAQHDEPLPAPREEVGDDVDDLSVAPAEDSLAQEFEPTEPSIEEQLDADGTLPLLQAPIPVDPEAALPKFVGPTTPEEPAAEKPSVASADAPDCGCGVGEFCLDCPVSRLMACQFRLRDCPLLQPPPPGPPPVRYRPEMPPQFLTVPTEPVLAPGRTGPVELPRGHVRSGFRPQLSVQGVN
ncbi:MAG: hypothetical protein CMJ58_06070 [Planctomycetaceae bacterium]|nr:hypothetical protein [Planctomycetaceae bacterium]